MGRLIGFLGLIAIIGCSVAANSSTTVPPTTKGPTTAPPTTAAPTTAAPTTAPPTTAAPTTAAPTTAAPTTAPPTTAAPTTAAPTTAAPTTAGPTTAAPTTGPVTTKPPPDTNPTLNNYTYSKGNTTCLLVQMVAYFINTNTSIPQVNVTDDFKIDDDTSSCNKLSVTFGKNSFALIFKNDSTSFYLSAVTANINGVEASAANLTYAKVSLKASYMCAAGLTIKLSNNITIVTKQDRFQAVLVPGGKFATAVLCSADLPSNIVIPIAVGCALAGLVVIVIIAYLIGRRRMKHRYEAM